MNVEKHVIFIFFNILVCKVFSKNTKTLISLFFKFSFSLVKIEEGNLKKCLRYLSVSVEIRDERTLICFLKKNNNKTYVLDIFQKCIDLGSTFKLTIIILVHFIYC